MTLDEAINHCLERANQDCSSCADEHLQLAEWLIELKDLRKNAQVVDKQEVKIMVDMEEYGCEYCNNPYEDCGTCPRNEARKREWEHECERERRNYRGRGGVVAD